MIGIITTLTVFFTIITILCIIDIKEFESKSINVFLLISGTTSILWGILIHLITK